MKTTPIAMLGIFFLIVLFIPACQLDEFQNIKGIEFEAEYAVPVIDASLSIQDLLDRSESDLTFLTIENDGSFTLSYQDSTRILRGDQAINTLPETFPVPIPNQQNSFPIGSIGGPTITSAVLKTGNISFDINSSVPEDLDLTITFPGLTKNGQALEVTTRLDYQGSLPVQASIAAIDLADYVMATDNGNLEIEYVALNDNNQSRNVDGILGTANQWAFDNIIGDWTQQDFTIETDTIDIDLYNNQVEGELFFSNPRLSVSVSNSFGVPVFVSFEQITILTIDNQIIQLEGNLMNDGFLVDAPGLNQQGETVIRNYMLDRTNSNIDMIFNAQPKKIWYSLDLNVAPGTGLTPGFVLQESEVNVGLSFELPIEGTAKGFSTENTVEVDLGMEEGDILKEAELKIITANDIPIDIDLQVYLLNSGGITVDSLFDQTETLVAANTPSMTSFIDLTPSRLANLRQSKMIKVRSNFSTIDNGATNVIINKDQGLNLKMGLRATLVQ